MARCWTVNQQVIHLARKETPDPVRKKLQAQLEHINICCSAETRGVVTKERNLLYPLSPSINVDTSGGERLLGASFARVEKGQFLLPFAEAQNKDHDLFVHVSDAKEISGTSFNKEWDEVRKEVVPLYHRLPPMLTGEETTIERQSLLRESKDQGLIVLGEKDGEFLIRMRRGASLRLVFFGGDVLCLWRHFQPKFVSMGGGARSEKRG